MGSPGSDGNTLGFHFPPTKHVPNLKAVTDAFVYSQIPGKRSWEEVLREVFREDYPDPDQLERVVRTSVQRIKEGYVPKKIMDAFREENAFNDRCALK